jgi:hypothetical protein
VVPCSGIVFYLYIMPVKMVSIVDRELTNSGKEAVLSRGMFLVLH